MDNCYLIVYKFKHSLIYLICGINEYSDHKKMFSLNNSMCRILFIKTLLKLSNVNSLFKLK